MVRGFWNISGICAAAFDLDCTLPTSLLSTLLCLDNWEGWKCGGSHWLVLRSCLALAVTRRIAGGRSVLDYLEATPVMV
jgi:hypothetical protein